MNSARGAVTPHVAHWSTMVTGSTTDPGCAMAQVTRDEKGKFGVAHEVAELHARPLAA